jgi:hypothetical protein
VQLRTRVLGIDHPDTIYSSKVLIGWETEKLDIYASGVRNESSWNNTLSTRPVLHEYFLRNIARLVCKPVIFITLCPKRTVVPRAINPSSVQRPVTFIAARDASGVWRAPLSPGVARCPVKFYSCTFSAAIPTLCVALNCTTACTLVVQAMAGANINSGCALRLFRCNTIAFSPWHGSNSLKPRVIPFTHDS